MFVRGYKKDILMKKSSLVVQKNIRIVYRMLIAFVNLKDYHISVIVQSQVLGLQDGEIIVTGILHKRRGVRKDRKCNKMKMVFCIIIYLRNLMESTIKEVIMFNMEMVYFLTL